jgi:hypothetical protein
MAPTSTPVPVVPATAENLPSEPVSAPIAPATPAAPSPVAESAIGKSGTGVTSGAEAAAPVNTGTVRVELKDGWGTVFVDGDEKGTAPPVLSVKLSPGSHDIEIRNPALPTVKRTVDVVAGKTVVVRHSFQK